MIEKFELMGPAGRFKVKAQDVRKHLRKGCKFPPSRKADGKTVSDEEARYEAFLKETSKTEAKKTSGVQPPAKSMARNSA